MSNNRGVSSLGLCHPKYQVANLINSFKPATEIRFGWLDNYFNPKNSNNAKRVLAQAKSKFCRVHIINGPGMNNGRTQSYEITYKETTNSLVKKIRSGVFMPKYIKRLKQVKSICSVAPEGTLDLCISPWLERLPIPKDVFDKLANATIDVFGPDIKIVDSPQGQYSFFAGYYHESHDPKANPSKVDIVDLDGTDIESLDALAFAKRFPNARAVLGWDVRQNGLDGREPWKPALQRVNFTGSRLWAFYQYFVRPSALEVNSELNPADVAGLKMQDPTDGWKRDFVWKLGDGRNFAVCLFPRKFHNKFKNVVVKKDGVIVDRAKFRGFYSEDGTNRLIYDFSKHTSSFPDNSTVVADGNCWVLQKPQYRID